MGDGEIELQPPVVVRAKLRPPRLTKDFVARPRLYQRLEGGLSRRLTLVVAPAGFGKTTVLGAWAASTGHPVAWLSVDETDDGCGPLLWSLIAALQAIDPTWGTATRRLLELPALPSPVYQAQVLARDLDQLGRELAIVLDDYHLLRDRTVQELIGSLLRYLPEQVQLVLAGREDPPLPLARLRARDELTELRAEELRFDLVEAQTFVEATLGPDVDELLVPELAARTEGWAAGLRLATLALRDRADQLTWVRRFSGDEQQVRSFLAEEVLNRQPAEVREFLLSTSILERVCAPLGEALLEHQPPPGAGQAVLEQIAKANLFVVGLDEAGVWYRYHRLFREALLHELQVARGAGYLQILHQRASDWFATNGQIGEAIQHALSGGNPDRAVQLLEAHVHELLDREDLLLLEACLRALPAELVYRRPGLLLARCWALQVRAAYLSLPPLLQRVKQLLTEESTSAGADSTVWQTDLDALLAVVSFLRVELEPARERGWRALQNLSPTFRLGRRNAAAAWAVAEQLLGNGETAVAWLKAESDAHLDAPDGHGLQMTGVLGLLHLIRGELQAAELVLRPMAAQSGKAGFALTASWCHYLLGRLHYLRNELAEAREQFGAVLGLQQRANPVIYRESLVGLALSQQALGSPDAARGTLGLAEAIAHETSGFDPQGTIAAAKWRLALLRGERVDVPRGVPPSEGESIFSLTTAGAQCPSLERARALLATGDREDLEETAGLVDWLAARLESLHEQVRLTEVLVLRALVRHAQADISAALEDLGRALALARPCGLVRPFVEPGTPLAGLLAELTVKLPAVERPFPERLLAAYPPASGPPDLVLPSRHQAESELVEPLTWREAEVLERMQERLTNKEIAQALTISPETVKKHVANICQKLHVTSRRQAVDRARLLGLLTPVQRALRPV